MQSVTSVKTEKNNYVHSTNLEETVRLQLALRLRSKQFETRDSDSEVS
jgi:hypothetical protein